MEVRQPAALPPTAAPSPGELSATLVPNTQLDLYIYIKQDSPTTVPAGMLNVPQDIDVESLAIWGVPAKDDLAFAIGITLTNANYASRVYEQMSIGNNGWKKLSGNNLYLVQGLGIAIESLKTAISNDDFKPYDNKTALKAVATLPNGEITKLAGVAIVQPTKTVMDLITKDAHSEDLRLVDMMLQLANLKVIVSGLYSLDDADIAKVAEATDKAGNLFQLDSSMVILFKSGRPGFLVEPIVKRILIEFGYTEGNIGGITVYEAPRDTDNNKTTLLRVEGNHIFIAISEQESYAKTLIINIQK